jgi:hypothetical protein
MHGRDHLEDTGGIWEDYNRLNLREIKWESVDCIHLAQERDQWQTLVNMAMKLWVP